MNTKLETSDHHPRLKPAEQLLLIAEVFWIAAVSLLIHAFFWVVEQILLVSGISWPHWAWLFIAIFQGLALLVPTALLSAFWPNPRIRQINLAWALGAVYVLLVAPIRLVPPGSVIAANALQIGLTLLAILLVLLLRSGLGIRFHRMSVDSSFWLAVLIAALAAYPWLMWGALGSPADSLLNLVASLLFGCLAALLLDGYVFRATVTGASAPLRSIIVGGFVGVPLLIELSSAFGFAGLQLLLLVVVPSFGLAAAAIYKISIGRQIRNSALPLAALIGLVAAAPAMLIDPDEMALVLAVGARDLLQWAFYAAMVSAVIGWSSGIILAVYWRRFETLSSRHVLPVMALISIGLCVIVYFAIGQPGFYGDQLFAILNEKADLSQAAGIDDLGARRAYVYQELVQQAEDSQRDLRQSLDRFGIAYEPYYLVNGLRVNGGPLLRAWLASRPEVDRVLDNPVLRPLRAPATGASGNASRPNGLLWNLQMIGAERVWRELGVTGRDIIVGQSDSGVEGGHPELTAAYRGQGIGDDYNWYDPWDGSSQPVDTGGHGTHTLGTILGANTGVAPGATWMGCVNLARNLANPSLYLDCMQFMLAPFPQDGDPFVDGEPSLAADVLNNSWGCPPVEGCDPNALLDAAQALRQAGIFVVVSAGNEGPFCKSVSDPLALYDEVFTVGAADDTGDLAFFSSVGPVSVDGSQRTKPELLAPGVSVLSAFPGSSYEFMDGTSMAGPHVTGVVALMWSANPALKGDIERTERILIESAAPYLGIPPACGEQSEAPFNGTGYGIVDAYAAVEAAMALSD